MEAKAFIVNECKFEQMDEKKQINHSTPLETITLPTLPYVNDIYAVLELTNLEKNQDIALFLTISDRNNKIIAFTDENNTIAIGEQMKTFCKIQVVHSIKGTHQLTLYCNGEPLHIHEYDIICEDTALMYCDETELADLRAKIEI
ncbi:hypothetical protein [Paenibacillus sp. 2003]|uniref:hypothetical protein n=1 Tax=Paenibacillus TaxID=44249 RepID=UPI00285AAC7E|nr:hypothetical protein [Paenibacillus sp. 2003]MDR6715733.1 hypothetical protein [Paenibacillus sp. 2003]